MVQPFTSCSCTPPKCYSALEVLPCGKGLSVYSEPDVVRGDHHRKNNCRNSYFTGRTPGFLGEPQTFKLQKVLPSSEPDLISTLVARVAARDSRPASSIRVLIRRLTALSPVQIVVNQHQPRGHHPRVPRLFPCLPTMSTPSNVFREPACARRMPARRRARTLKEQRRPVCQRVTLCACRVLRLPLPWRPTMSARPFEFVVHAHLRRRASRVTRTMHFTVYGSSERTPNFDTSSCSPSYMPRTRSAMPNCSCLLTPRFGSSWSPTPRRRTPPRSLPPTLSAFSTPCTLHWRT